MAGMDCCALPPGSVNCHCGRCHVTFATLESFDDHLVRPRRSPEITGCRTPASLGLIEDDRGTWRTPEGLDRRNADKARLLAARSRRRSPAA
jgi:hypothetical protein